MYKKVLPIHRLFKRFEERVVAGSITAGHGRRNGYENHTVLTG